jgi:hypothetical protein
MLSQIENPTVPVILPFEMWLGVMVVALLLVIAIGWLIVNAISLRKIDRRLKTLEGKQK